MGTAHIYALAEIIVPICICGVLPVLIVFFTMRAKSKNDANKRDIIMAALEKNPDIDVQELISGFQTQKKDKMLKEKLLKKLLWGCICTAAGLGMAGFALAIGSNYDMADVIVFYILAMLFLPVGIAFLLNYFVGRKMLAGEIAAEEKQKLTE